MTVGELGRYFANEMALDADLSIVEMERWSRDRWFDDLELTWVPPSPNMPSLDTALVYPGTCLFEATTLSEGRGTTNPFELIGAPWVDATAFAAMLNDIDPRGEVQTRVFHPMFSKHERSDVEGVQVHVLDRDVRSDQSRRDDGTYCILRVRRVRLGPNQRWLSDRRAHGWIRTANRDSRRSKRANLRMTIDHVVEGWEREAAQFLEENAEYLLYDWRLASRVR
ncbi:DUF1343 domain-containing protein [Natrialba swarupiae]|nr:DUF1343 domain-containing protein [Natrialba swarupiae]